MITCPDPPSPPPPGKVFLRDRGGLQRQRRGLRRQRRKRPRRLLLLAPAQVHAGVGAQQEVGGVGGADGAAVGAPRPGAGALYNAGGGRRLQGQRRRRQQAAKYGEDINCLEFGVGGAVADFVGVLAKRNVLIVKASVFCTATTAGTVYAFHFCFWCGCFFPSKSSLHDHISSHTLQLS